MKSLVLALLCSLTLAAQTTAYVRAGAPQPQVITGASYSSTWTITTQNAHGLSSSCNLTTNLCECGPIGTPTGTGPSSMNGVKYCTAPDTTHIALYQGPNDASPKSNLTNSGGWWNGTSPYPGGQQNAQWVVILTPLTEAAGPIGLLDGTNGDEMRRLSLGTQNGMASTNGLVLTGCPSACVIVVNTTYNPSTFGAIPVAAGAHFSVTGTGTSLDTCGDGTESSGAQSPYTVAAVTSSGWTSVPFNSSSVCSASLTNQDYTHVNDHCGPPSIPNDLIGGTIPCPRVSQIATTANYAWTNMLTQMANGESRHPRIISLLMTAGRYLRKKMLNSSMR